METQSSFAFSSKLMRDKKKLQISGGILKRFASELAKSRTMTFVQELADELAGEWPIKFEQSF